MDYKPSVVFLTNTDIKGDEVISSVDALFGAKVYSVCGCASKDFMFAMTDKGVMNLNTGEYLNSDLFKSMVCGSNHFLGLASDDSIYTWGRGTFGELGLGLNLVEGDYPVKNDALNHIKSMSSGKNHAVAIDDKGIGYAWGQNFDKQLGIYKKSTSELLARGGSAEEVIFRPRLIPLSLTHRIARVGCGDAFTVVVTEKGSVYTWGSGESGQLGYGRLTNMELPGLVAFEDIALDDKGFPKQSSDAIVDVACGFGHVLAMSRGGDIYGWGFNKRSQLGLGDTNTRHYPAKLSLNRYSCLSIEIDEVPKRPVTALKIFAEGHSSAFISEAGELYAFGSNMFNRLALKPNDIRATARGYLGLSVPDEEIDISTRVSYPTLVSSLVNCVVSFVSFSKSRAAIMVYTQIMGITPTIIPHRNCSKLTLNGCGFYPSDNVVIKFVPFEYGSNGQVVPTGLAPRSCSGLVESSSSITLVPPRLHDKGLYYLLLSLDGGQLNNADNAVSNYINAPGSIVVKVHRELTVSSLEPRIVDSRSSRGPVTCTVGVMNAESLAADTKFTVKVSIKIFAGENGDAMEVVDYLNGTLIQQEESGPAVDTNPDSTSQLDANSSLLEDTRTVSSSSGKDKKPIERKIAFLFDYSKYAGSNGNPIMTVVAQVSINKADYTVVASTQSPIIFHAFLPMSTSSLCLPYEMTSSDRETRIFGESFMPKTILPAGIDVISEFTITIEDKKAKSKSKKNVKEDSSTSWVDYGPVNCQNSGEMKICIPTWIQMMKTKVLKKGEKEKIVDPTESATEMKIRFFLQSKTIVSTSKGDDVTYNRQLLCDKALSILLISSQISVSSSLQSIKCNPASEKALNGTITQGDGKPFDFLNRSVVIQLYSKDSQQVFYTLNENEYEFIEISGNAVVDKSKINNSTISSFLQPSYNIQFSIPSLAALNNITSYVIPEPSAAIESGEDFAAAESTEINPEGVNNDSNDVVSNENLPDAPVEPIRNQLSTPFDLFALSDFYIYLSFDTSSSFDPTSAPVAKMAKVNLFSGCSLSPIPVLPGAPVPKGGNPGNNPGASVTLPATNLKKWMTNDLAKARMRGVKPDVYVDVPSAILKPDDNSVILTLPDLTSLQTLEPELRAKEKWYFIDMSVDGGQTYDTSDGDKAIIQMAIK